MQLDLNNLPTDTALLHGLVRDMASVVERRDDEIERLQLIVKQLQRARFGSRSEHIDADQLALGLEDVETDIARAEAAPKARADRRSGERGRNRPSRVQPQALSANRFVSLLEDSAHVLFGSRMAPCTDSGFAVAREVLPPTQV